MIHVIRSPVLVLYDRIANYRETRYLLSLLDMYSRKVRLIGKFFRLSDKLSIVRADQLVLETTQVFDHHFESVSTD